MLSSTGTCGTNAGAYTTGILGSTCLYPIQHSLQDPFMTYGLRDYQDAKRWDTILVKKSLVVLRMEKFFLSLALGILGGGIGYLAQRSRMCFVAGFRDYFLVRDRELMVGVFAFIATVWLLTSVLQPFSLIRSGIPQYGETAIRKSAAQLHFSFPHAFGFSSIVSGSPEERVRLSDHFGNIFFYITFAGGLLIGFVSTLAGGCVLRQHVLLAQGNMNALYYIAGFYSAVVVYYIILFRFAVRLY